MTYDYRAARDRIFGVTRENDRIVAYEPGPANIQERALLLALVEFAPNIEPSETALATMLGTSERHVRRLIRSAESKDLLRVEHRTGRRSRYILAVHPGLSVPPQDGGPRTNSPPTPDQSSEGGRTNSPPKQTREADKKAEKISASTSDAGTYRLEAPNSEERKKTDAHQTVVDYYHRVFEAHRGCKPAFGGAEGTAVQRVLKKLKGNHVEACRRIDNAFSSWRKNVTILDIAKDPDAFAVPDPPRQAGNGHSVPDRPSPPPPQWRAPPHTPDPNPPPPNPLRPLPRRAANGC